QVGFPGGRQQQGETDYQTAVREVREEIGLDLDNQRQFRFLAQLPDRHIDPYKKIKPLSISTFVFLQVSPLTPRFHLEPREVAAVIWAPFAQFGAYHPP